MYFCPVWCLYWIRQEDNCSKCFHSPFHHDGGCRSICFFHCLTPKPCSLIGLMLDMKWFGWVCATSYTLSHTCPSSLCFAQIRVFGPCTPSLTSVLTPHVCSRPAFLSCSKGNLVCWGWTGTKASSALRVGGALSNNCLIWSKVLFPESTAKSWFLQTVLMKLNYNTLVK